MGKEIDFNPSHISSLHQLEILDAHYKGTEEEAFESLNQCVKLNTIILNAPSLILKRFSNYIIHCTLLEHLMLEVSSVTTESMMVLGQLTHLEFSYLKIVEKKPSTSQNASFLRNLSCTEFSFSSDKEIYDIDELPKSDYSCSLCSKKRYTMLRCKGCNLIYYCSSSCQKNDWNKHRAICKLKKKINKKHNID